jgi:hypothetical protein
MTVLQTLRVGKDTGTYADVLLAVGTASLLDDLAREAGHSPSTAIEDLGDAYVIRSSRPVDMGTVTQVGPGYRYLLDKTGDPQCPTSGSGYFDYVEERKRRESAKQASKQRKAAGTVEADRGQEPSTELPIFAIFNKLRSGSPSYNRMHALLRRDAERLPIACARYLPLLENTATLTTTMEPWEEDLDKAAASLQFFNPIIGKGIHRLKPDGTGLGGYGGRTHWFIQWLRLRGFDQAMLAYWINNEDVEVLVIAPGQLSDYSTVNQLRSALLAKPIYGKQRLDCEAILTLGEELIRQSEHISSSGSSPKSRRNLNRVVRGFAGAYFKSLGAGLALTNVSFLGLPGWLPVTSRADAAIWLELIAEHHRVVRRLREDHSDEVGLLLQYRDCLSSGQLADMLEFFSSYAAHLMGTERAPNFSVWSIGRLFMSYSGDEDGKDKNLGQIIDDPGFQAIATAVRRVTVIEQYRKAGAGRQEYEIRYGLAQEWKRKAKFRDEFVCELAAFVASFNNENARRREQGHWSYAAVTTAQLTSLIALIDLHGAELVGMLLLAFGYASERKPGASTEDAGQTGETNADVQE